MCAKAMKNDNYSKSGFYIDFDYSQGKWFSYPDQPELKLKLRYLSPSVINSLKEDCRKENGEVDEDQLGLAVLTYIIVDWKGFFIGHGEDAVAAPMTKENLDRVNGIDNGILRWTMTVVTDRRIFEEGISEEKLVKN